MGDYHTTYKDHEGTTTEWDDIQASEQACYITAPAALCRNPCMMVQDPPKSDA